MPEPRVPKPDAEAPAPLLARVATSPSERWRALALLPDQTRNDEAESEVVVLYDPADTELAGTALIARLSPTTIAVLGCGARWVDQQTALCRLLRAVADRARTRDATYLVVRTNANDVILQGALAELGFRSASHALVGIDVAPEHGAASWFALCL